MIFMLSKLFLEAFSFSPYHPRNDSSMGMSLISLEVIIEPIPYPGGHLYALVLVG